VRDQDIPHQCVGLVADHDVSRFGDQLQARREVRLGSDDRIVHPVGAAEISDVAVAGIDTHPDAERVLHALIPPFHVQFSEPMLHVSRHVQTSLGVFRFPLGFRIAKKDQNGVADEFVNRAAVLKRDIGHFGKRFIEQRRDLFRLQTFRGCRKILDGGKEDRELLALGMDRDVLLDAEDALLDLRRKVARNPHR
jgi:hypothetical protein